MYASNAVTCSAAVNTRPLVWVNVDEVHLAAVPRDVNEVVAR